MKWLCLVLLVLAQPSFSQENVTTDSEKENPILYLDFLVGAGGTKEVSGLTFGLGLNYQKRNDLFTFKMSYVAEANKDAGLASILIIPIFVGGDSMNEYALLYGKRFVFDASALSISAGFSSNIIKYDITEEGNNIKNRVSYMAFPFEINYHFFKSKKKRFRVLYGLIPVGKPTAFGRSFGLKLYGSFGKFNSFGLGVNIGLGWHKKY